MVLAMPGINLTSSVECGALLAAGANDPVYQEACRAEPPLGRFVKMFVNLFGESVTPSLILLMDGALKPSFADVINLRNVVALPVLTHAWLRRWQGHQGPLPLFADHFDLHPATVSSEGHISVRAIEYTDLRVTGAERFMGQPPAGMNTSVVRERDDDLQEALVSLFIANPADEPATVFRRKVFTSLKFAMRALSAPTQIQAETADWAVTVSMWVSAFEALAHPGSGGVKFPHVSQLLKDVPWLFPDLRAKDHQAIDQAKGEMTTLPVQIYGRLYRVRNACLHGGDHFETALEPEREPGWGSLALQLPPLYRSVLLFEAASRGYGKFAAPVDRVRSWTQREFEEPLFRLEPRGQGA